MKKLNKKSKNRHIKSDKKTGTRFIYQLKILASL